MSSEPFRTASSTPQTEKATAMQPWDARHGKPWLASIAMAIVGAAGTWAVLQSTHPLLTLPPELQCNMGSPLALRQASFRYQQKMKMANPAVAAAIFGAIVAGTAALAWLGRQRSKALDVVAVLFAVTVGGAFGGAAGYAGALIANVLRISDSESEISKSLIMHVSMALIFGAAVGVAVGALMVRTWRAAASALVAGIAAGFLAGAGYVVLTALFLQSADTSEVIPENPQRILWLGLLPVLAGLFVTAMVRVQSRAGTPDERGEHETEEE